MPVSRFVTMAELFAAAAGSVMLATGRGLKTLRPIDVAVIPAGAVISAHTFPLMAWHTVDGLLVGMASLLMLRSGVRRSSVSAVAIGGALAGFAPLVKQSYAAVPIIALAWFIVQVRRRDPLPRWRPLAVAAATGLWVLRVGPARLPVTVHLSGAHRAAAGLAALALVAMAWSVWDEALSLGGSWGAAVWWAAFATMVAASASRGRFDDAGAALLALGWCGSLSWGYANVNLFAGALAAYVAVRGVDLVVRVVPKPSLAVVAPSLAVVVIALSVACVAWASGVRGENTYRDLPESELHSHLSDAATAFGYIRTNVGTATYVKAAAECRRRHPSGGFAILPDNAVLPTIFGARNPLPGDWWYILELPSHRERIMAQVGEAGRRGDYLVLFQTFSLDALAHQSAMPTATADSTPFDYEGGMVRDIYEALPGDRVECGPFIGIYKPAG